MRLRSRITVLISLVIAVGLTANAGAHTLAYAPAVAANAIHDAGVQGLLRQAPITDITDPRWPAERRLGKVSGRDLAQMDTPAMVNALRSGWSQITTGDGLSHPVGGLVAVDEIVPTQWTPQRADQLRNALAQLGGDANRVIFYISPALVGQVGRVDVRAPLPANIATLFAALASGGKSYLEMYTVPARGRVVPMSAAEMATNPTRWLARWPAERHDHLHLLIGPGLEVSQAEIWNRLRATPAGRRILGNGPGYYGGTSATAADGRAWAAALAEFRRNPAASPPGGDVRVATGQAPTIQVPSGPLRPGSSLALNTGRPGVAVIRLISASGVTRVIRGSLTVPASGEASFSLPRDIRPGSYTVRVSFLGDGIRDESEIPVQVPAATSTAPGGGSTTAPRGFAERLLEGQRVSQEAVRILNATQAWLDAGIATQDLAANGFGSAFTANGALGAFAPSISLARGGSGTPPEPASPRPITPAPARSTGGGQIRVTPAQLLTNQRISQAAVLRANALERRLREGLTGGDLRPEAITPGKLAEGVIIAAASEQDRPAPSTSVSAPLTLRSLRGLKVTSAQLTINLRIAEAARDRARALATRLQAGLTEADFQPGSVVAANLAPQMRP